MSIGLGYDVDLLYIVSAFGRCGGNCKSDMFGLVWVRKFWVMGPQRPCGSMANGRRIVFAFRKL